MAAWAAGVGGDAERVSATRPSAAPRRALPAAIRSALHRAVRGRRLRRLLLVARARDEHGAPVPARLRPAAPELAPAAGRLPRPGRDGRRQRHAGAAAVGTGQAAGRGRSPVFRPSQRLDVELELGFVVGAAQRRWGSRCRRRASATTSSASSSSTTGAPATSRRGSTSRSGRSSGSRSRPRSARG